MSEVDCPRAKSCMTPCVARDGQHAACDDGLCVGCGEHAADLLTELVKRYVDWKGRNVDDDTTSTAVGSVGGIPGAELTVTYAEVATLLNLVERAKPLLQYREQREVALVQQKLLTFLKENGKWSSQGPTSDL